MSEKTWTKRLDAGPLDSWESTAPRLTHTAICCGTCKHSTKMYDGCGYCTKHQARYIHDEESVDCLILVIGSSDVCDDWEKNNVSEVQGG